MVVVVVNQSRPPTLGENLVDDAGLACRKMGIDISFTTKEQAHIDRHSLFWVIGIGKATVALETAIALTLEKLSSSSGSRIPICVTVENSQLVKAAVPNKGDRVVWMVLSDPRSSQSSQPPRTPGVHWIGTSSLVEKARLPSQKKPFYLRGECIAGIRIAKIISLLSDRKELPLGGGIGLPHKAMIEVCRSCNLRCVLCPIGNSQAKQLPPMVPNIFKQIIDSIAPTVWKAKLYNYGEPLLHPRLPDFISYAKNAGIEWVEISTNGMLLTADLGEQLLTAGLDFLRVSIDGIDQSTYAKYRRGGIVDQVWANLREFRKLRDRVQSARPVIEVQCLATCYTEERMDELRQMALNAGADDFRIKTFNAYMSGGSMVGLGGSFLPRDRQLSRYRDYSDLTYRDQYRLSSCRWPYERLVVNADGTIVPCCYDFNTVHALGSFCSSPEHWWWTPERQRFVDHLAESPCTIEMCTRCPVGVPNLAVSQDLG